MRRLPGLLVAFALGLCGPAFAQEAAQGRYQIVPDAERGVWLIDTATGAIAKCAHPPPVVFDQREALDRAQAQASAAPVCSDWAHPVPEATE